MGQKRKKEQKLIFNRIKQRKFAAKYGLPKPVRSEPQSNVEQTDAPQVNTEPEELAPYTIAETALNINGNENVKTHLVSIPDFYARRDERVIDTGVEAHVRSELFKIFSKYNIEVRLELNSVGVYILDIVGREESLGCRQPQNPVVNIGVKPCC